MKNENSNRIWELLLSTPHSAVSIREMMDKLGLPRSSRKSLLRTLRQMEENGDITKVGKGKWKAVEEENLWEGKIECHPDGYAFVRINENTDVFIPPDSLGCAMHEDIVKVKIVRSRRDGRLSGKVVSIVERGRNYIVGTYRDGYLYPTNEKILYRIFVPQSGRKGVINEELAEIRITEFPTSTTEPEGEIVCRLGVIEDPSVDMNIIISEHNLPREFSQVVLDYARNIPEKVSAEEMYGREDLRDIPFVTVDPESARDFDDAVYAVKEKSGWRLWVAIADVSHYVQPNTPTDDEAFARGTSVYFPEGVIPMLPEEISAGIASLKPGEVRLAMVVEILFGRDGLPRDEKIYPAVIKSAMRLTYKQVSCAMLENDEEERKKLGGRVKDLEVMLELADTLRNKRRERGGLDFDLPEAMVLLGAKGEVTGIYKSVHDRSHNMIEEFMLSANEAVARYAAHHKIPTIYRVHEEPSYEKLMELNAILGAFGLTIDVGEKRKELSRSIQKILDKVRDKPYEVLVNTSVLRSMKRARYDTENLGHFGLAADYYLHFTSPIRRYPDLFVHRMLKAHLAGKHPRKPENHEIIAARCSELERKAEEAERDMDKLKCARFMKEHIGEKFDGFISGVTQFGFFVEINDYFVEGMVPESRLEDDVYEFNERGYLLRGRYTRRTFRLGDPIRVVVAGANIEKRQVDFDIVNGKSDLLLRTHPPSKRKRKIRKETF